MMKMPMCAHAAKKGSCQTTRVAGQRSSREQHSLPELVLELNTRAVPTAQVQMGLAQYLAPMAMHPDALSSLPPACWHFCQDAQPWGSAS